MYGNWNLLEETIHILQEHRKTVFDVEWVGLEKSHGTWDQFAAVAKDINYDPGYGRQWIPGDLIVVGNDWWLSRDEYDGSEWWEFNCKPDRTGRIPISFDAVKLIGAT